MGSVKKKETQFRPRPGNLAHSPVSVHLPKDVDQYVRALPNRSDWLREVICAAVAAERLP
jgi:hypothetical protein